MPTWSSFKRWTKKRSSLLFRTSYPWYFNSQQILFVLPASSSDKTPWMTSPEFSPPTQPIPKIISTHKHLIGATPPLDSPHQSCCDATWLMSPSVCHHQLGLNSVVMCYVIKCCSMALVWNSVRMRERVRLAPKYKSHFSSGKVMYVLSVQVSRRWNK